MFYSVISSHDICDEPRLEVALVFVNLAKIS